MKKRLFLILALMLTGSAAAHAQLDDFAPMPSPAATPAPLAETASPTQRTPDITVGMIYHKLTGRAPDYNVWAMQTDAYKAAAPLERAAVMEREAAELRSVYALTTLAEPIIVQKMVTVSEYSPKNKGFSIDDFTDDTYFGYSFGGQDFAVIIPDLLNQQWQPIEGDAAGIVDIAAEKNNRQLLATLYIRPTFADQKAPMVLDQKTYWLISGELQRLTLTPPGAAKPVFERAVGRGNVDAGKPDSELLNLYQGAK